jgi:hypothetical protein
MIQPKSKKNSPRREPKQSKKPHVCPEEVCPEEVCPEYVSLNLLVDEHCEPIEIHPIEIHSEPEPEAVSEPIQEKYGCPCGSSISIKSKSKHEKTKKHLDWLLSQDTSVLVL